MDDELFVRTMIEVLKYDKKYSGKKDDLLPILRRVTLNRKPQWGFVRHGRPNQRYEDIELRIPVPLLNEANNQYDDLYDIIKYVYEESDEYALGELTLRPKIIQSEDVEYTEHDVVFTNIQEEIIQGIRDARYSIWAAVAWLTNRAFINELRAKKQQGVSVRLIVSDEDANRPYHGQLSGFDTVLISRSGWREWNRMHDKFCIIDFEYVMHGSYNWTKTAEHNDETLATAIDRDYVKKFSDEFVHLYRKGRKLDMA